MPKVCLLIALVCAIGCGREKRQIHQPDFTAVGLQSCVDERAKLVRENELLKHKLEAAQQDKKPIEEDPRICNLEYAKSKDMAELERILRIQKAQQTEYETRLDEQRKKSAKAELLPYAPLADFPSAPSIKWEIEMPTSNMEAIYGQDKLCHLHELAGNSLKANGSFNNNWPHFIQEVMSSFESKDNDGDVESDDYSSAIRIIELFKDSSSGRRTSDELLTVLVKSPPSMQWAVGLALRLDSDAREFAKVRLQRLYKSSQTNFSKLDKNILVDDQNLVPEFDFGVNVRDGNYYKGLLLRFWRFKEATGRGRGDKFVKDLQKVMKEVAKGMKVNLQ